jgi:hypothetical protein
VSKFCGAHRAPRAGIDPITGPAAALAVIRLALASPPCEETIVVLLDPQRRGRTVVVVDGCRGDDDVIEIVERLAEAIAGRPPDDTGDGWLGGLVVASVRRNRGIDHHDADRWLDASDVAERFGVELIEWFVIDARAGIPPERVAALCPRDLLAEPPRWFPS